MMQKLPLQLLLPILLLSGCASDEPFVEVNNPFQFHEEAAAMRNFAAGIGNRSKARAEKEDSPGGEQDSFETQPRRSAYFGDGAGSVVETQSLRATGIPIQSPEAAPETMDTDNQKVTATAEEPPPAPRQPTGAVCYQCNGKGYAFFMTPGEDTGDQNTCAHCGGTGRR